MKNADDDSGVLGLGMGSGYSRGRDAVMETSKNKCTTAISSLSIYPKLEDI